MQNTAARELVSLLTAHALRYSTGLLFLTLPWLGREQEIAARLGAGYVSYQEFLLRRLAPDQRYLALTWQQVIGEDLDTIVRGPSPDGSCVVVANADIVLSALRSEERHSFWENLREIFRPSRGLLLALPEDSRRLISSSERARWFQMGRAAIWESQEGPCP